MRFRHQILAPLVTLVIAAIAGAENPAAQPAVQTKAAVPSMAGAWKMPVDTPHGNREFRFDLTVDPKDGKKITGTISLGHGEPARLSGEFVDGKLTFKADASGHELTFTGTLKDVDTMPGVLSTPNGDLQGIATRVKPSRQ